MSDDADKSQDREELEQEIRKKYIKPTEKEVEATGICLNCGEPVRDDVRWCDVFCRNDWQSRQRK